MLGPLLPLLRELPAQPLVSSKALQAKAVVRMPLVEAVEAALEVVTSAVTHWFWLMPRRLPRSLSRRRQPRDSHSPPPLIPTPKRPNPLLPTLPSLRVRLLAAAVAPMAEARAWPSAVVLVAVVPLVVLAAVTGMPTDEVATDVLRRATSRETGVLSLQLKAASSRDSRVASSLAIALVDRSISPSPA